MKKVFLLIIFYSGITNAQLLEFKIPGYDGLSINGGGCWEVIPFDIDSDSDLDIIVLRAHEYDEVYLNDGLGHFTLRS